MTSDGPTELPDWAVSQREHLEASVVGRFGVHPPWCEPVGRIQFSIDPGPTFGHGGHPSTVLVLAEIDRIEPEGLSVLDVGVQTDHHPDARIDDLAVHAIARLVVEAGVGIPAATVERLPADARHADFLGGFSGRRDQAHRHVQKYHG